MDFNLDQYTIILLAINLASTLVGNAYYILRKKYKKSPSPSPPSPLESPPPAPFASPATEWVTEILERV